MRRNSPHAPAYPHHASLPPGPQHPPGLTGPNPPHLKNNHDRLRQNGRVTRLPAPSMLIFTRSGSIMSARFSALSPLGGARRPDTG